MFKSNFMRLFLLFSLIVFISLLYYPVYEEKQHIVKLLQEGEMFFNQGNYDQAVNALSIALTLDENNTEILGKLTTASVAGSSHSFAMAIDALANEDYITARNYFKRVLSVDKDNYEIARKNLDNLELVIAEVHLKLAKEYYAEKNYTAAYGELTSALNENPNLEEASGLLSLYKKKNDEQLEKKRKERELQLERERKERELQLERERKEREAQLEEQRKRLAEEQRQREIERMKVYENDRGSVKVAVSVKTSDSFYFYSAGKNHTFVQIWVNTKNYGTKVEQVSYTDFSLATQEGFIVTPHKLTESSDLSGFRTVKLQPNTHSAGWLIFYIAKSDRYTLFFDNQISKAEKTIIIE